MAISEKELFLTLSELYPSEIEYIVGAAKITPGVIPPMSSSSSKERAKALIEYFLDSYGSLRRLYELAYQVTNLYVMRD